MGAPHDVPPFLGLHVRVVTLFRGQLLGKRKQTQCMRVDMVLS